MLSNHQIPAIPTHADPMPNANHKMEPSIVFARLIMLAIRSARADLNVFWIRIVLVKRAALKIDALILVKAHVVQMPTVELPITFPFAAAKSPTLEILTDLAVQFLW
jgi:hypothetical protein